MRIISFLCVICGVGFFVGFWVLFGCGDVIFIFIMGRERGEESLVEECDGFLKFFVFILFFSVY